MTQPPKELVQIFLVLIFIEILADCGGYLSNNNDDHYVKRYEEYHKICDNMSAGDDAINIKHKCELVKNKEKAILDARVADATDSLALYTKLLFFATVLLAAVTGALVVLAVRQGRDAIEALKIAARNASAATTSADALVASERAHIRVQAVRIDPGDLFQFDPLQHGAGKLVTMSISWKLENHGKTPADIDDVMVDLWVGPKRTEQALIPMRDLFQQTIPSGQQTDENSYSAHVLLTRQLGNDLIRKVNFVRAEIFIFYYDVFGKRQREHVRWRYDSFNGGARFAIIERDS